MALWISAGFAGNEKTLRVERIKPELVNGYLTVSANFQNLFSERITGTIQSGLPSVIQIEIKLMKNSNQLVKRKQIVHSISYDIWDELYSINTEDSTEIYKDFTTAKKISSRLEKSALIAANLLTSQDRYSIHIRVGIIPISSKQGAKIADWLLDPNQTEENLASEERASGFKLNLSNLVSFFVGGKKRSRYSSDWFTSETFFLNDLK